MGKIENVRAAVRWLLLGPEIVEVIWRKIRNEGVVDWLLLELIIGGVIWGKIGNERAVDLLLLESIIVGVMWGKIGNDGVAGRWLLLVEVCTRRKDWGWRSCGLIIAGISNCGSRARLKKKLNWDAWF